MIKSFINRPVLSTVVSILIVILGILGIVSLPISQYPDIAPVTVQVSANYAGANAETVLKAVVIPRDFRDCILTYFPIPRHCPCNGAGIG